jgi:homocysteine S-methyltransferase
MGKNNFSDQVHDAVILGDGAFGTYLYEKGVEVGNNLDILNLKAPDLVYSIHEEYVRAGSQLIETNTFGANYFKLRDSGNTDQVREINLAAVTLARKAAGKEVFIAGSIGPSGVEFNENDEGIGESDIVQGFREQIEALAEGGVDLFIIETFSKLDEILLAIRTARSVTGEIPIVAQMVFPAEGRTSHGVNALTFRQQALDAGAMVVGSNCGRGVKAMSEAIELLSSIDDQVPLSAFPNAGMPEMVEDRMVYPAQPAYMARNLSEMIRRGVRLIGGCCGTSPAHIHEFRTRLHLRPVKRLRIVGSKEDDGVGRKIGTGKPGSGGFLEGLRPDRLPILVELDPPKHLDIEPIVSGARALAESGADAITLAENPLAILRADNLSLAHRIREEAGCQAIIHLTCRDRNGLGLQTQIMGAHLLGLEAILGVTGDSASASDQPGVSGVFDVDSMGLVRMINQYNHGYNMAGKPMRKQTNFSIGVAFSFKRSRPEMQIRRLERKAGLGAHFAMTQPLFDRQSVEAMVEKTSHLDMLIFPGIFPLVSARNADFLHNEVPGIFIPESIRNTLWKYEKVEDQLKAALEITTELVEEIASFVDGLYIISPLNKWRISDTFVKQIRAAAWTGSGRISKFVS